MLKNSFFKSLQQCKIFNKFPNKFKLRLKTIPSAIFDGFTNLLSDLHRNNVVAVNILIIQPPMSWSHEVLIFNIDETLGTANCPCVGSHDWIIHRSAFFRRERSFILQFKPENKNKTSNFNLYVASTYWILIFFYLSSDMNDEKNLGIKFR